MRQDSVSDREGTLVMNILLKRILDRLVRTGNLKVTGPKGLSVIFGDGSGDLVHMHI
jgi:cyclopropane-fatty-acyl-phospholipid synthase